MPPIRAVPEAMAGRLDRADNLAIVLFGVDVAAGGGLRLLDLAAFVGIDAAVAAGTRNETGDVVLFGAKDVCFMVRQLA